MKLLSVAGANLASLSTPFIIGFEDGPLAGSGIFVISGPTGSGKSTVLDAICLALYGQLPRLRGAERAMVGRSDAAPAVGYDDPRGILTHGAGEGHAEVVFLGQDGRRYAARWEVWRTRRSASGALQATRHRLTDLASQSVIGDGKEDTLRHIAQRVGLTFDQFCRAVLLAQGEFDSFVRAKSRERADLLERITGTEIYTRLSRAAYARASTTEQAVTRLRAQLEAHAALGDEERATLQASRHEATATLTALTNGRAALEAASRWHAMDEALARSVAEAGEALRRAQADDIAAEPARAAALRARKALGLRAELEAARSAARSLADATAAATQAEDAEKQARAALAQADDRLRLATEAAEALAREHAQALPEIDSAMQCDAELGTARAAKAGREAEAAHATEAHAAAVATLREAVAHRDQIRHEYDAAALWLSAHAAAEPVAHQIDWIRSQALRRSEAARKAAAHGDAAAKAQAAAARFHERATAMAERTDATRAGLLAVEGQLSALEAEIGAIDLDAAQLRCSALEAAVAALGEAALAAASHAASHADLTRTRQQRQEADAMIAAAENEIADLAGRIPGVQSALAEAEASRTRSEQTASDAAAALRAGLVDGQPCPVCGSTSHELTAHSVDAILKQRLAEDSARVDTLRSNRDELVRRQSTATARRDTETARRRTLELTTSDQTGRIERAFAAWTAARQACNAVSTRTSLALVPEAPDEAEARQLGAAADEALGQERKAVSAATRLRSEALAAAGRRDQLRTELQEADAARRDAAEDADKALRQAEAERQAQRREAQTIDEVNASFEDVLAPALADWRTLDDPAEAAARLAAEWRSRNAARESLAPQLALAEEKRAALEAELHQARLRSGDAATQAEVATRAVAELEARRTGLLGGRSVAEVRGAFAARETATGAELGSARAAQLQAAQHAAAAVVTLQNSRSQHSACGQALESARLRLKAALAREGLDEAAAEQALDAGADALQAAEDRLKAIADVVLERSASLRERQAALDAHRGTGAPPLDAAATAQELAAIGPRITTAEDARAALDGRIAADDRTRELRAEAEAKIRRAEADGEVWRKLSDLIGAADGAKFRRYFQTLTLEVLVALANRHLADLHPRYELQRAQDGEMALQVVDRGMADEVRGLHNLSGGERFLVSLALALGLASLSSNQGVRVESLFIDEGFGTLDPHSLGTAISALDRLQATGRQVGIISHVEELKERIAAKVEVSPLGGGRSTIQLTVQ